MNTTVEKDATAYDISDESKDKKWEILPRYYILLTLTHSLFSDWQEHNSQGSKKVWTMPGFLFIILEWLNGKHCLPGEAIDEVAVSAVTKDIAIDEAEEKGDEVCDLSQEMA